MKSNIHLSPPSAIELFAGVGGFRLGLDEAGWRTIWSNQWEPATKAQHASSCYVRNFGDDGHSNRDLAVEVAHSEEDDSLIPQADLIVGGFPCQDYSVAKTAGSSKGLEGKKGVLWWEIHKLVSQKKPKFVFLENVDRLLKSPSGQRGRDFAIMLRTLGDLGYRVEWRIANAAEHGFPQRRIRVFIVATLSELANKFEEFSAKSIETGILGKALKSHIQGEVMNFRLDTDLVRLSDEFNLGGKTSPFLEGGVYENGSVFTSKIETEEPVARKVLGDILLDEGDVPSSFFVDEAKIGEWEYLKGSKKIERVTTSGHKYLYSEGRMAFPDSTEKPSRTILTAEGGTSASRFKHVILTSSGHRRLTPIELERLNGFPDNWTKYDAQGNELSDSRRAFFMGNALVVGLVTMVASEIKNRLNSLK
ncbi:DNA (cytosine-5-)-methyltransferase [Candidatus Aquiluna sp. UB-MaderosW2red]|uniref:DNA (cytosine-5-)-methyltransferase n=1 Tax=Candidatus Aquiluna sp. UB-MaderosW2red TaxID=1855377 RepID=UPI000875E08F|nr:DNA (cytosine-5-)-methyltransferase [Candidatus Aquiluna sp. UB-MaderosW2red]SCX13480.1 DNA (cytosine-5)-methyltransferase 1 [Candidatus Aquiluna sp. UB-MaderosW2red]